MLTQTHTHWRHTIAKTRAEFSLKVSRKCFVQNYCFQKSAWLVFTSSLPDEWTQGFPMKAFCENFTVTTYYTEDTTALYILMVYSFDWRRLQYQHETLSSKYVFFSFLFFFFFQKPLSITTLIHWAVFMNKFYWLKQLHIYIYL